MVRIKRNEISRLYITGIVILINIVVLIGGILRSKIVNIRLHLSKLHLV